MLFSRRAVIQTAVAAGFALTGFAAHAETKLTVGAYPANPPWEFKNESGVFEGFEVDLAKAIATKLGATIDIQDMGFQALFAATSSNRIDMAISTITITKERLKNQAFTQGYYDSDMALAGGPTTKLKGLADLKGATVGVLSTSTGEAWAKANTAKYGIAEIKGYNTQQDLLLEMQNGRVDGGVSDIAGMSFAFLKMPGMKIVERIPTGDEYGIMMPKGSPLAAKINDAISELKKDGTVAALHKKWLGTEAEANSSMRTVKPMPTE